MASKGAGVGYQESVEFHPRGKRTFFLRGDRIGVVYHEYHGVYCEDVETALRFLLTAMSPKSDSDLRVGTAETEVILNRFTRSNLVHPTYSIFRCYDVQ